MKNKVPNRNDWGDVNADSHLRDAFHLYGGKTVDEAAQYFVADPIQQAQVLRYSTPAVFDYYVFCFVNYLTTEASVGESDMASCFLNLIVEKSDKDPLGLARIYPTLSSAVEVIAGRQQFYEADQNIYGSFREKKDKIQRNMDKIA